LFPVLFPVNYKLGSGELSLVLHIWHQLGELTLVISQHFCSLANWT